MAAAPESGCNREFAVVTTTGISAMVGTDAFCKRNVAPFMSGRSSSTMTRAGDRSFRMRSPSAPLDALTHKNSSCSRTSQRASTVGASASSKRRRRMTGTRRSQISLRVRVSRQYKVLLMRCSAGSEPSAKTSQRPSHAAPRLDPPVATVDRTFRGGEPFSVRLENCVTSLKQCSRLNKLSFAIGLLMLAPLTIRCGSSSPPEPWVTSVPKATCKAGDRVEPGLQGQTSLADRNSGASTQAYNCNLELVGQHQGNGGEWQLTWFNDCAYYGTYNSSANTTPGVVVLNVADPANPVQTTTLTSRAMLDPWESLKVNEPRKALGATKGPGFGASAPTDRQFAFYDI